MYYIRIRYDNRHTLKTNLQLIIFSKDGDLAVGHDDKLQKSKMYISEKASKQHLCAAARSTKPYMPADYPERRRTVVVTRGCALLLPPPARAPLPLLFLLALDDCVSLSLSL